MSNADSGDNRVDSGDSLEGSKGTALASVESCTDGAGSLSAVNTLDPFTSRATALTSNVLTLLAYTLNWYSHAHGQPEYFPDWVLGLIWAPWGVKVWDRIKGVAKKR